MNEIDPDAETEPRTNGPASEGAYTSWSILGSGEAGTRVASLYFLRHEHASIEDRILLLNSNEGDLHNVAKEIEEQAVTGDQRERLETAREHMQSFGAEKTGAGNDFFKGEELARNDFDTIIRHRIQDVIGGWADIVVSIAGLGGGTGNGSVPYLIYEMKHGDSPIASEDMHQFSVAIWPSENESLHRQFNAVGGFSRLLRFGDQGRMNADAVILCDNTTLVDLVEDDTEQRPEGYREINNRILQVLDGLISPSRRAVDVIDAKDYVKQPHDMGVQHFTAGMSLDNYTDLLTVEGALDIAAENTLTPVDPETALACYCVIEVPEDQVGQGEFTPHEMGDVVQEWTEENTAAKVVYDSIVPREDLSNTFNALVFLGGFDLEPFLEPSLDAFEQYMSTKEISLEGVRGQEKRELEETLERGRELRERLDRYLEVNRKQRAALGAEV